MLEEKPSAHSAATVLAALPGKAIIRQCVRGCVHVTYGPVTLDLACGHSFGQLAEKVEQHPRSLGDVHLQYYHATLRFSREEFDEFCQLVRDASRALKELDVLRRLLATA